MKNLKTFQEFINSQGIKNKEDIAYPHNLEENIELYRKRLIETDILNERVMSLYFSYPTNICRPMLLEKVTLDRIVKKHGDNGFICISAWRSEFEKEINEKNTKKLISELKKSPYRYLPVYGGYTDKKMKEFSSFEPSFIVFSYDIDGEKQDFDKLKEFGVKLCGEFNQSSVLIKSPQEPPIWLDRNGKRVSKKETNLVYKNDPEQEFYTSFISLERVDKLKTDYLWQKFVRLCKEKGLKKFDVEEFKEYKKEHWSEAPVYRRITFDIKPIDDDEIVEGMYVNPSPCDRNEWIGRQKSGEILVMLELFED